MGLKFKLAGLLMIAMALTTTVIAIDLLKGVTLWDVAEMRYDDPIWDRHYKIEDYHPVPWRFESTDANAQTGVVEAQGLWVGTWKEVGPCTIFCQMTSQDDAWYLTFVNSKYFVAYMRYNEDYLYRFGHLRGVGGQSSKSSAITPSPATLNGSISMEQDTDRPGMNYKDYAISSADPQICANDCANDPNCKAFTYVKPGVRGSDSAPECWLKNGVPNPVSGECCVSGVK
jgi:opacity protein-like surface antigen